jgi:ATP-dependent Lon protease
MRADIEHVMAGVPTGASSSGLEYFDVGFSYRDLENGAETFVGLPESGGGMLITGESLPAGSAYTLGSDRSDPAARKLALFLIQTQVNPGSGRVIPLGNLSTTMKEALKVADAYLRAHLKDLGIDRDPKQYDFSVQAVNLNQAKEGAPKRRSGSSCRWCPRSSTVPWIPRRSSSAR